MVEQTEEQGIDIKQRNQGRKIIVTIVAIPVVIILFSSLLYYLADNKIIDLGTVNHGELMSPPVQFSEIEMNHLDGGQFDYAKPDPKWAFVVIGDRYCQGACEKMLYLSRQTNVALAKKMNQLRRIYITTDDVISDDLKQLMAKDYPHVTVATTKEQDIKKLFKGTNVDAFKDNRFFVVDQRGWIMMHYTAEDLNQDALNTLGKKIVKDMKRLLN